MNESDFLSSLNIPIVSLSTSYIPPEHYNELVLYTAKALARIKELESTQFRLETQCQNYRRFRVENEKEIATLKEKIVG